MHKDSPFHTSEQAIQSKLGMRDKMEQFGQRVIRDYLPEQHRDFYRQLPVLFLGHSDKNGWPWASILFNPPGFIESPDKHNLKIKAKPLLGDPLHDSLQVGLPLGILGLEFHSKRRNRASTHIRSVSDEGIEVKVNQSFGNCPKYINDHQLKFLKQWSSDETKIQRIEAFDQDTQNFIAQADTFFVASEAPKKKYKANEGADISHRGGKCGFIRIDNEKQITIPDYSGNFHFNTFGNFLENPKAGLLFIDFTKAKILTLTGHVKIIWESVDIFNFPLAERLWTFEIDHGYWLHP